MSLVPTKLVVFRKDLSQEEIRDTADAVRGIAGYFMVASRGNPVQLIVNDPGSARIQKLRALPGVDRVAPHYMT
jgi:hypothetical protein